MGLFNGTSRRNATIQVESDQGSTLHLIKHKELEIDAQLLAVRQRAEGIVADARRRAAERIAHADIEADERVRAAEAETIAEAQEQARMITSQARTDLEELTRSTNDTVGGAAEAVLAAVLGPDKPERR
jgi:vacuolar-type H+-ATPase subunit H